MRKLSVNAFVFFLVFLFLCTISMVNVNSVYIWLKKAYKENIYENIYLNTGFSHSVLPVYTVFLKIYLAIWVENISYKLDLLS